VLIAYPVACCGVCLVFQLVLISSLTFTPPPSPTPHYSVLLACLRARCHWPDLDIRSLKPLARFHRDAMIQSGAYELQHLADEFALFQEVLAA
jgi:hypothetical protein